MNILIFGMSLVSWKNNFAIFLSEHLKKNNDVNVDIIGIGGGDAGLSAAVMNDILSKKKYDLVFLDLLARSGPASGLSKRPVFFFECYKAVVSKVVAHGAVPVVMEFYREAVDPLTDKIFPFVKEHCLTNGVVYIDLAEVVRALPENIKKELFIDTAHTTEKGAIYYAEEIFKRIVNLNLIDDIQKYHSINSLSPTMFSLSLPGRMLGYDISSFERSGFSCRMTEVIEKESLILNFRRPRKFVGIVSIKGPLSGEFLVGTKSSPAMYKLLSYDKHSYYERASLICFKPFVSDSLVITQLPSVPNIALNKGNVNKSHRVGKFGYIMWSKLNLDLD